MGKQMIFRILLAGFGMLLSTLLQAQTEPYIFVLGVGQDASFPQAGCYKPRCMPAWEDSSLRQEPTAIAVIDRANESSYLFEATPEFRDQLYRLQQEAAQPLSGIFLTHAHIGHYTGLMHLGREAMGTRDMPVYAMPRMSAFLRDNGPWSQLVSLGNIELRGLQHMAPVNLSTVTVTPFLVPHRDEYSETVGYRIQGPNRSAIFIPDINKWEDWDESIVEMVESVDYALIDASFFADGELGNRDMSQIPHPFVAETMALFEDSSLTVRDRIWFIHMNQSNPLLNSNTEQTRIVLENGFNVAREGVRLPL
ncbi:MAG TPA: pyrroloquinoline quinone biosynthesis protein PqqB [Gammaproteobacteria bacterium]|nr:pyrroloquinoline quinone biosynthesis protein PqqB [Gammaproteobacteria bacterium]